MKSTKAALALPQPWKNAHPIALARIRLRMRQKDLGDAIGRTSKAIADWENGRNPTPRDALLAVRHVASEAGVNLDDIAAFAPPATSQCDLDLRGLLRRRPIPIALQGGITPDGFVVVGAPTAGQSRVVKGKQCGRCGHRLRENEFHSDFLACPAGLSCPLGIAGGADPRSSLASSPLRQAAKPSARRMNGRAA